MTQVIYGDRVIYLVDMKRKLVYTMLSFIGPSLVLSVSYALPTEDVTSLSEGFSRVLFSPLLHLDTRGFQRITLGRWLEEARLLYVDRVLPQGWFNISDDNLMSTAIWKPEGYMVHWLDSIANLRAWWNMECVQWASVEWRSSARYIEVVVTGSGEDAEVTRAGDRWSGEWPFWVVTVARPEAARVAPEALAAKLLVAQVVAMRNGGSLTAEVEEGNRISMVLRIPRADAMSPAELEADCLPKDVAEDILLRVVTPMLLSGWLSTGKQLLELSSKKIPRLEMSMEEGVIELVKILRRGEEKLAQLLLELEEEMARWEGE